MKYPKEVQAFIDVLSDYKENNQLEQFDILHLYPKEIAYPNGYYDSRFFELVGFNTVNLEKRNLGRHDKVDFDGGCNVRMASVFADGAYLLRFNHFVYPHCGTEVQCIYMKRA